jgi:nucleoside-diphosphate-sugar epimerase
MVAITGLTEEQVPKRFKHPYAATKYLAEQKVFGAQEFGLETLALRPRFVTGAGDSIFPRLLNMQRKRLAIIGNGLNKVDFTSMQNLNEALLSVADQRVRPGQGLQHQQRDADSIVGRG